MKVESEHIKSPLEWTEDPHGDGFHATFGDDEFSIAESYDFDGNRNGYGAWVWQSFPDEGPTSRRIANGLPRYS